jgi:acetyl/propionyl-CoA carboxylase alpha subunit
VKLQIRIAAGEPLRLSRENVRVTGHVIEARLYAVAPHPNFLSQNPAGLTHPAVMKK